MAYPISIITVCLIGFALAAEPRKGGKGFYISSGLGISFVYLTLMKVIEPFGATGTFSPLFAAVFPHVFFLAVRSEAHTSELQSRGHLVCRLLLETKRR